MTVLDKAASPHASASRFCIVWEPSEGPLRSAAARDTDSVDHAAHYAMALARTLTQAGHPAERLDINVVASTAGDTDERITRIELDVTGHVPGLDGPSFESLARIAVSGCRIWNALPGTVDVRLLTRLLGPAGTPTLSRLPAPALAPEVTPPEPGVPPAFRRIGPRTWGVLLLMLWTSALLLPQLLVSGPEPQTAASVEVSPAVPTVAPPPPTAVVPTLVRPLLDQRFTTPLREWPNDTQSTAWFGDGTYHLFARQPTRFVAISSPSTPPLADVEVHGAFRKVGGPPGGGYGLIVRDASAEPRDGRDQDGRFVVAEVGDRGEIGIWRREQDHWVDLVPWTRSAAVRAGEAANELALSAIGGQLTLNVNGLQVAQLVDSEAPTSGRVGVFVGGDLNHVALDSFAVVRR
jgi:hypothetical protein